MDSLYSSLENGDYDKIFRLIYGDQDVSQQRNRWGSLVKYHQERTGNECPRLFSSPGRTELSGNHTDHNRGKVLAAGIQLDTIAAVNPKQELIAEVISQGYPPVKVDLSSLSKISGESGKTESLVRGIAASIVRRGGQVAGFTASTTSRVPKGSGLSSSAALEVLVGSIFNEFFNQGRFTSLDLAIIGQEAENDYFDKPSGLMDQIACALGAAVAIDFANNTNPQTEHLKVDFAKAGYTLAVVDSRGDHADLTPDYTAIPREMGAVASQLGTLVLRDASEDKFYATLPNIRNKTGDRAILRAIHFYNENRRVDEMVQALGNQDIPVFLDGVRQSGDSSYRFLQNVFSPHNPAEQALALALALSERFLGKNGAARVHGGGFAGTIQVFIPTERFLDYVSYMENFFGKGCVTKLLIRHFPAGELKVGCLPGKNFS